jgi:hypothetical protein
MRHVTACALLAAQLTPKRVPLDGANDLRAGRRFFFLVRFLYDALARCRLGGVLDARFLGLSVLRAQGERGGATQGEAQPEGMMPRTYMHGPKLMRILRHEKLCEKDEMGREPYQRPPLSTCCFRAKRWPPTLCVYCVLAHDMHLRCLGHSALSPSALS